MKLPSEVEYIIVGQGLAGSAVAMQLLKLGKKILVIDEPSKNTSSRVAAGLFNPITGKNLVKTWMADQLFPYLHQYYFWAEELTGEKFFHPMSLYRPFASIQEQNEWMGRSAEKTFENFVESVHTVSAFGGKLNDPFGGMILRQCGYLNTSVYLDAVRKYIEGVGFFNAQFFNSEKLTIDTGHIIYEGCRADKIIFCEGEHGVSNKWFEGLPIRPLKGETITIKSEWQKHVIPNRGVYMVPGGVPGEWRVGSTYDFNDVSAGITAKGRMELEEKLNELILFPYTVLSQDWGVRPTTSDRRPILGRHPEYEHLAIFNGLGTKGVSLAPYFSDVLIRSMVNNSKVNKEVDVTRYKLLY